MLAQSYPQEAEHLMKLAQEAVDEHWRKYEKVAEPRILKEP